MIFFYGGPSHLDTFDLKPNAPSEVRGEFKPIMTSAPGLQICEHLPQMAKIMHKVALVRGMHHAARLHDSASIHALTGRPLDGPDRELFAPLPQFYPSHGSAMAYMHRERPCDVPFAALPFVFRNVHDVPCQGGGFLGSAYDPLTIEADTVGRSFRSDQLLPAAGLSRSRLRRRRELLHEVEARLKQGSPMSKLYEKAYALLDSERIRQALDISRTGESAAALWLRFGAKSRRRGRWRRQWG